MTYEQTLLKLATENDNIVVLTAENRVAIRNLPPQLGDRFIDFGICEQTMVGAAAGLALRGRIPVVHALATFLTMRAFEFIRTDVGIGRLPVKLVGGVPGFLSDGNGPTHQAIEDISLMRGIPGMEVFCPADEEDLVEGIPFVLKRPNPCYIRYNAAPPAVKHRAPFEFGKAETVRQGSDAAILTYGMLVKEAAGACELLEKSGIRVRLLNLRTLKPIDGDAVISAATETPMVFTVEDHLQTGGLFSIVSELLVARRVHCPVLPIALPERWFAPALLPDVLDNEGFTGRRLAERVGDALKIG